MAVRIKITNGTQVLNVSQKAFDNVYAAKGFSLVKAGSAAAASKPPKTAAVRKTGKSAKSKAKAKGKEASDTTAADASEKPADS